MKLGSHHTPETREKIGRSNVGKHQPSPETIERIRHLNLGKHLTFETKQKLSQANSGRQHTPEEIRKMCGRRCTPEAIERMSQSRRGRHHTAETREKIRHANSTPEARERTRQVHLGRNVGSETREKLRRASSTPEAIEKIRHIHLGRRNTPETIEKMRRAHSTPEARKRNRQTHLGKHHSAETKEKIRISTEQCFADPEYVKHWSDGLHSKTRLEKRMDALLQALYPNEFEYNGGYECGITIGGFTPDFVNVNGKKQLVEAFGRHWHPVGDDKIKQERYAKYGYASLIIWDYELKDKKAVIQRIVDFVGKPPNLCFGKEEKE